MALSRIYYNTVLCGDKPRPEDSNETSALEELIRANLIKTGAPFDPSILQPWPKATHL
jgi:hypothetical protein